MQELLIIQFAKYPEKGNVKTRLEPLLGKPGSYQLHINLVCHTANTLLNSDGDFVLALNKIKPHNQLNHLIEQQECYCQQGDDLGERMSNAIAWGLKKAKKVIIVGSDCPALTPKIIQQANEQLNTTSHVLIPAEDGGYVLIGAAQHYDHIFNNMPWGSNKVLAMTLDTFNKSNYTVGLLDPLWDVDVADDFIRLERLFPELCVL